jgi:hypothetical protein
MPPNTSPSTSAQPTTSAKPLQTLLKALISPCGLLLTFIAVAITLVSFVRLSSQGYDGLELARWTAVKEFHKECENHQVHYTSTNSGGGSSFTDDAPG